MGAIQDLDLLVVGAGPTGLALALQAASCGARVAVLDSRDGTPQPSRALVLHPRTLEVLRPLGVTDELAAHGRPRLRAVLHTGRHRVPVDLDHLPLPDTAFGHLLLVSQALVERVLGDRLAALGVPVHWGAEVRRVSPVEGLVQVMVEGRENPWEAMFVVGCDGADSTVRQQVGISFPGRPYRHSVVVADVEVTGFDPGAAAAHVFVGADGLLFFFALGERATWRLIAAGPHGTQSSSSGAPDGTETLRRLVSSQTAGVVRLTSVAWTEHVRLRHHLARCYRRGNVFVAGDAAHVHSPAGAQGMNTGIQDACNLGWKLALAAGGWPDADDLLDSYERERRPVARLGTAWTSLAWWGESATGPAARLARQGVVPRLAPVALHHLSTLAPAVRLVTGLAQTYRRSSALLPLAGSRKVRAGDRLPDVALGHGAPAPHLHDLLADPAYHLLLLGDAHEPTPSTSLPPGWVRPVRLDGAAAQRVAARLRVACPASCLVRPDGYVQQLATVSHVTA